MGGRRLTRKGKNWSVEDSAKTYAIEDWSNGYFSLSPDGYVMANTANGKVNLLSLVQELHLRGLDTPILLRFMDLLESRVTEINNAFRSAIEEYNFQGRYRGVYPIKVNQHRHVVERLLRRGRDYHLGLEVGSKPELLAAVALFDDPDALLICNGFKDEEYIETALLARRLQEDVIVVLDRIEELDTMLSVSKRLGIPPRIGVRCRLSARGAGKWEDSGGDRAKFGLTVTQLLQVVERLKAEDLADSLSLLHFHVGSQINDIRAVKRALVEATRIYAELYRMGAQPAYMDVGGGLGVSYAGKYAPDALNYSTQEYANDVIYWVKETCDSAGVPHPNLVSESGRALVAHHSVLIFDVMGVDDRSPVFVPPPEGEELPKVLSQLLEVLEAAKSGSERTLVEAYHDAVHLRSEFLSMFGHGLLTLSQRAAGERMFAEICRLVSVHVQSWINVPPDLARLPQRFADVYYCNFSLFQSLPDSWALDQVFPIMPLHRLDEKPTRRAILADLTCDSDGKVDKFSSSTEITRTLPLHSWGDDDYYLGAFLVGAYQETLGDLHNLFGDTNTVLVSVNGVDDYDIEEVVEGDSVQAVLGFVGYSAEELQRRIRKRIETAVRLGRLDLKQSRGFIKTYAAGLRGYTYLEREHDPHSD
ncbi:MAG: biosynthetic arginine decarboxylase [Myxococcales bacterium]|nr:biosynthetic arginine decarboxylase [Myxococcales bacterium]